MKRFYIIIALVVLLCFCLSACKNKSVYTAKIDYGNSKIYSREDMDEAIEFIKDDFNSIKKRNCELHKIKYSGDECNSEENIEYCKEFNDKDYTQCIIFYIDFRAPDSAKDGAAWELNEEYTNWNYYFARTDGGEWEYITSGY